MLRVVVDVNVLVSGTIQPSSLPGAVISSWRAGRFELVVSRTLVSELRDVLRREHVARYLLPTELDVVPDELEQRALVVEDPPPAERLVSRDPDDDYIVALARAARAHVIVTGDADLLEAAVTPRVSTPRDFLAHLDQLGL